MRILFLAGRELEYPRNDVMLRALKRIGKVDVITEHGRGSILLRSIRLGLRGLRRIRSADVDLIYIGFFGHFLSAGLGPLRRAPLLLDAFVSTYDTLVEDRGRFTPDSMGARLALGLDRAAARRADHILMDTELHCQYFQDLLGLPASRLSAIPVGCNEDLFYPRPAPSHNGTRVLYYSSFLPLHGVETVVRAAGLLKEQAGLHFQLIGEGPDQARSVRLAHELGLTNIAFAPGVPVGRLPEELAAADICLGGHFGSSAKAGRVVPGKLYQMLAMARPVIAGDTPANRALLLDGTEALFSPPGDPDRLAEAILRLHLQPELRSRLGAAGRARFEDCCSERKITELVEKLTQKLVDRS